MSVPDHRDAQRRERVVAVVESTAERVRYQLESGMRYGRVTVLDSVR